MRKTSLLPEREYIAILALVVPLVASKQDMKLTPGDFDSLAYAKEVIESLAIQRLEEDKVAVEPSNPPELPKDDAGPGQMEDPVDEPDIGELPDEAVDNSVDKPVDEIPAEEPEPLEPAPAEVEPNDPAD